MQEQTVFENMAAPSRMSSVFSSRLHLNSSKDVAALQADERGKLVLLVKTWRAKYEKAQASNRQSNEYIKVLEADLARIRNEKEKVTSDLMARLEKDQEAYKKKIKELRVEADTARNKPEIEARYLRQKLEKVTNETQPIIEFYKKRDEEKEERINTMQETIEDLQKRNDEFDQNLLKLGTENDEKMKNAEQELEELKAKYLEEIEEIKNDCANRIEETRFRLEEKAEMETRSSISRVERSYQDLQEEVHRRVVGAREEIESDYKEHMATLVGDYDKQLKELNALREKEKREFEKKICLGESNVTQFKKEKCLIDKTLEEATDKLRKSRQLYHHLVFWELDGKMQEGKEPIVSSANLSDLLQELATCQKDLRRMKLTLEQYDKPGHILEHIEKPQLITEIDFYIKVNHIEYIKKLIRMKRLSMSRRIPRYQAKTKKPFVVLVPNTIVPDSPPVVPFLNRPTQPKPVLVKRKPVRKKLFEVAAEQKESRDQWLYRQPSTVQLFPTINGRDFRNK